MPLLDHCNAPGHLGRRIEIEQLGRQRIEGTFIVSATPFLYLWTFAFVPVLCKHNLNVTTILDTILQRHQFTGHHLLKAVATTHNV